MSILVSLTFLLISLLFVWVMESLLAVIKKETNLMDDKEKGFLVNAGLFVITMIAFVFASLAEEPWVFIVIGCYLVARFLALCDYGFNVKIPDNYNLIYLFQKYWSK